MDKELCLETTQQANIGKGQIVLELQRGFMTLELLVGSEKEAVLETTQTLSIIQYNSQH